MKRILLLLPLLLLLILPTAQAEKTLVIATRAEDVYVAEQYIGSDTAVLVMTGLTAKQSGTLNAWLKERGAGEALTGSYSKLTAYTEKKLNSQWKTTETKAYRSLIARIRVTQPETLVWSVDPEAQDLTAYMASLMAQAVQDAQDPTFRGTETIDQYGCTVAALVNAATGETTVVDASGLLQTLTEKWGTAVTPEIPGLPQLNAEGFLDEGSFSWKDAEAGTYYYVDTDIRVTITRHINSLDRIWYEADVLRRAGAEEHLHVAQADEKGRKIDADTAAAGWVLAVNSDYHQNRTGRSVGIIVRDGVVVSAHTLTKANANRIDNLDSLMLTKDGGFTVWPGTTLTASEALAMDACDVLSFGPIYLKDGLWRQIRYDYRMVKAPRTALGLLGENHYLLVFAEGRLTETEGMTLPDLQQLFLVRGCTDAIGLDGGRTACMYFMGEQVGTVGNGTRAITSRPQWEMLTIGSMDDRN